MKNLLYILLSVITLALAGCSTTDNIKEADTTVVVENADEKETELSTYESEEEILAFFAPKSTTKRFTYLDK